MNTIREKQKFMMEPSCYMYMINTQYTKSKKTKLKDSNKESFRGVEILYQL